MYFSRNHNFLQNFTFVKIHLLILGVPVNFNRNTRTCRSAGIEIKNLEVDVAPSHKRSVDCIFEEYKFVSYVHKYIPSSKDDNLRKYMTACNAVIDKLQNKFNIDFSMGKFTVENKPDFEIDNYINEASIEMKLLTALKSLVSIGESNGTLKEYEEVFQQYVQNIGKDIVNNLLANDYCLRFMFEVVLENAYRKMNVLEISSDFTVLLPIIIEITERFSRMKFKNKILVCTDVEKVDKIKTSECGISVHPYESLSSVAPEKSQNVVVTAVSANTEKEARKHVQLLSSLVEQKGFVLLFHKNCLLPPENLLASLASKKINIVPQPLLEDWFQEEGFVIISRISHPICGNLYLLRLKGEMETGNIVHLSEDKSTWLEELKESVVKENKKTWVVSEDCPTSGIVGMINCLRHEPNGENIR